MSLLLSQSRLRSSGCFRYLPVCFGTIHRLLRQLVIRGFLLLGFIIIAFLPVADAQTTREAVGYTDLASLLGSKLPTGVGVPVAHVEPEETIIPGGQPVPGRYLPIFNGSNFAGINFDDVTGSGDGINNFSGHATGVVGSQFYGRFTSLAAGVDAVSVYEAGDWANNVLNMVGRGTPDSLNFRVANFSYVQEFQTSGGQPILSENIEALERFDYLIDNNNMTAVIGTNGGTSFPLFTHSYNAIRVGVTVNQPTTILTENYGPGRQQINIVAPYGTPSAATAFVSSAATLLHDGATQLPVVADRAAAANSEVIKATLLAGATKDEFTSWSRTTTSPLDAKSGAGELNVLNSYLIQFGGRQAGSTSPPSSPVSIDGWDYSTVTSAAPLYYDFEIPDGVTGEELSIVLTWNAEVTDTNTDTVFAGSVNLANLDLKLYDSTTSFLGSLLDDESVSVSTVDNVEHIYQTDLAPGRYTLELSADQARDFGLAWRLETSRDIQTGDFDGDGDSDGSDFLNWQRNVTTLTGATLADGDADGDGDVDADDLSFYQNNFSSSLSATSLSAISLNAVPEPQSLWLLAAGSMLLFYFATASRQIRKSRYL